jgi:hypothetical protein
VLRALLAPGSVFPGLPPGVSQAADSGQFGNAIKLAARHQSVNRRAPPVRQPAEPRLSAAQSNTATHIINEHAASHGLEREREGVPQPVRPDRVVDGGRGRVEWVGARSTELTQHLVCRDLDVRQLQWCHLITAP